MCIHYRAKERIKISLLSLISHTLPAVLVTLQAYLHLQLVPRAWFPHLSFVMKIGPDNVPYSFTTLLLLVHSRLLSINFPTASLLCFYLLPSFTVRQWRWRLYIPLKHRWTSKLHGVTSESNTVRIDNHQNLQRKVTVTLRNIFFINR
jgi:hypothetical protein